MSSPYPVLGNRPIDHWKVTELKEELKRRKLTTRGLKEDLIKRLDEALRAELDAKEDVDSGSNVIPMSQSDQEGKGIGTANEVMEASQPSVILEDGRMEPFDSRTSEASVENGSDTVQKAESNLGKGNEVNRESVDDREDPKGKVVCADGSATTEEKQPGQISIEDPAVILNENVEPAIISTQPELRLSETYEESADLKPELEKDNLSKALLEGDRSADTDASIISSGPDNQISEVSPALEFQVKSPSTSAATVLLNNRNEPKESVIVDDVHVDAKTEILEQLSSPDAQGDCESHQIDLNDSSKNKLSIEENGANDAELVDIVNNVDIGDSDSPEKLNLDRSSGDDSMEEDVLENKENDSKSNSDVYGAKFEKIEATTVKEEVVAAMCEDVLMDTKVDRIENETDLGATSAKRKFHDESASGVNDMTKRSRRWQSEAPKLPGMQSANAVASATPKGSIHSNSKSSFSKPDSTASEEAPKDRIVPPSSKPPTNSLRIDRFLRPFTLKAVQELLGKTGTVTSFWMDPIKTHCFVTYSSVEEAIETRNAVYNLQWPTNGGRLLTADFVEPQEVKERVEAPPVSPATPVTPASLGRNYPSARPSGQPQPSPRQQQVLRQQLPLPPPVLPHPPLLSNPPPARENALPAKEQLPLVKDLLPPPPPIPEKVDPPTLTLDDLFRKTKATPRIYYLPLSDEQVAVKLKAQGKNIKQ